MSVIFISGMETWDLQEWEDIVGASFESTVVRTGNGALSLPTGDNRVLWDGRPNETEYADWAFSFGFRISATPSATTRMLLVGGDTATPVVRLELRINTSRQIVLQIPSGPTGSTALDVDTWYLICIVVDSVANTVKIYLDDSTTPEIDHSGALAGDDVYTWQPRNASGSNATFYFDDCRADDVATRIGLHNILALCPNANGNDAWDTNGYAEIDDWIIGAEDGTSTEASLTASPSTATDDVEDTGTVGITGTINAVIAKGIIKRGGGGGGNSHHLRIRDHTPTDVDSADLVITNQYNLYSYVYTSTMPTLSQLDNWEVGGRTSGSQNLVATALALMIDYTPSAGDQTISPSSISSAESVSNPTIVYDQTIITNSILSIETFGTTIVVAGAVIVTINSIPSAEIFENPVIIIGAATITANSIPSAEAFGIHTLALTVAPNSIPSTEAIGSLTIGLNISANSIPSAESVVSPQVNLTIRLTGISSAEAVGNPTVTLPAGDQTVTASSIPSAEVIGTLTIGLTVSTNSIVSAETFGTQQVNLKLEPSSIPSAETFGTQQVNLVIDVNSISSAEAFGTTIVTNATIVSASSIPSAEAIGSHQVNLVVTANSIISAEAFGTATLVFDQIVTINSIPSAEAFGTLTITNATIVSPSSIPSSEAFGTTVVIAGVAVVQPNSISSAEAFGSATIVSVVQLQPTSIVSAEAVGNPTVIAGPAIIQVNGIPSAEAFGTTQIIGAASIIAPGGIPSAEVFGSLAIGISVSVNSILSAESFTSDELVTDGQDMGDVAWIDVTGGYAPVINEQVALHDGQTNCRHFTTDDIWQGVQNDPLATTVTGRKYKATVKVKVISGEASIRTIRGSGGGSDYARWNLTPATWTEYILEWTETAGGSSFRFFVDGGDQNSEVYFDEASVRELVPTILTSNIISPTSINSAENVSNSTITLLNTIQPNAISTAEVVNSPTVNTYADILPLAIPSGENVVGPKINLFVAVNSIASAEAFGTATLSAVLDQTLVASSIISLEAFGLLTITAVSSKRWLIINNIITTLQGITIANGYLNTVNFVSNQPIDYDEIEDAQIPFCMIDDVRFSDENLTNMVSEEIDDDLIINVKAVFRASSGLSRKTNSLIKDIRTALYNDLSRGENADITKIERITSRKTDKKDTVEINFRVVSEFAFDASTP